MDKQSHRRLRLTRSLAILDLETTGRWPEHDRIVEIGIVRVNPDGTSQRFHSLINPETKIPREATEVHGIDNHRVQGKPNFGRVAAKLRRFLGRCDLAGFNIRNFDLPFLVAEFRRTGDGFELNGRHIVDVKEIFHRKQPRHLAAAYEFYCGERHTSAHSALGDATVCWEVLQAQVRHHEDLPRIVQDLGEFCLSTQKSFLDSGRWFEPRDGKAVFTRGKHAGLRLKAVAQEAPDYLEWMLREVDLPDDSRRLVTKAVRRARE